MSTDNDTRRTLLTAAQRRYGLATKLANDAGISLSYWSKILAREKLPEREVCLKLAALLGVDPAVIGWIEVERRVIEPVVPEAQPTAA